MNVVPMHLNTNVVSVCTECGEELRVEYGVFDYGWGMSGFCLNCKRHFPLCGASKNLATQSCIRAKNHSGSHKNGRNNTWK
jgi:hypothetical protein